MRRRSRRRVRLATVLVASSLVAPVAGEVAAGPAAVAASRATCHAPPADSVLATRIASTRSLALTRLRAAAAGRTDRFPESAGPRARSWNRRSAGAWTAGFYPASLWQAYGWTRDRTWLLRARTWTRAVRAQARNTGTHDLGFVIGTSVGRAAVLDPSPRARTSYKRTVLSAARTLAKRWEPSVGAVHSATYDGRWAVIVDSAMNMELLFRGAAVARDADEATALRAIAHRHLLTLARDFVRADGSTFHRMVYDPETGKRLGALSGQAYSQRSMWSRGQAWAIYGFASGYRRTQDVRLLAATRRVADAWMTKLGPDCVPKWDFDAPAELPQKDSSAGAVAAAGLLMLARVEPDAARAETYRRHALAVLAPLLTAHYTTAGTRHPAVLRRQSYNIPVHPREASYIWGDHYLLEAMSRAMTVLRVKPTLRETEPSSQPPRLDGAHAASGGASR